MFVASWSFDVQWGKRDDLMKGLKEFKPTAEKGWRAKSERMLAGSIGAPESRIVFEYEFASLADLEASWAALHTQKDLFQRWVASMKDAIVPGSPRWEIYRVLDV
jgi:hypothetical protein